MRKNICLRQSTIEASPSIDAQTRHPVLFVSHVTSCLGGMETRDDGTFLLSSTSLVSSSYVRYEKLARHVFYFIESMVKYMSH